MNNHPLRNKVFYARHTEKEKQIIFFPNPDLSNSILEFHRTVISKLISQFPVLCKTQYKLMQETLVSIFIIMNVNRTLSPVWLAAGCHVSCPSTHGHCITHDYRSTGRTMPGVWDVPSFCSSETALQLFLCTPSQIHSKPEQVHMTVKLQQLKMEHGISCQQEGCFPPNFY